MAPYLYPRMGDTLAARGPTAVRGHRLYLAVAIIQGQLSMSPVVLPRVVALFLLCGTLAAPVAASGLLGPSCLEKLTDRTRLWAECTQQFDRADARCRKPTARMHESMQKCARDGDSKAEIDEAMTRGYRLAGERGPGVKPAAGADAGGKPGTPQPREGTALLNQWQGQKQPVSPPPSN